MFFRASFVLAVSVLAASIAAQTPTRLTLGTYAFRKPTEIYKQFQPVTIELSRLLTAQMGEPMAVELHITKSYEECLDSFVDGKIDMVRFGPASYVLAKRRNPKVELLGAEKEDSRGVGLIVVRDDSPIKTLGDLVGKRFAFGDPMSTIGRYLSQAELARANVVGSQLAGFAYLDRHDIVFKAVEIGDYDAGALHADTWKELNGKAARRLRILHSFDNVPKPWVARAGLGDGVVAALRTSLLKLDEPAALKALKVPGFVPTTDVEYDIVRKGMEGAARFAPLEPPRVPTAAPVPAPSPAPTRG